MKIILPISLSILSIILSSCAGLQHGRIAADTLAGAGGALLANKLSNGDAAWTAAGAGAGVLLSEGVQQVTQAKTLKAFEQGYDKGRSDTVKQQYWMMADSQKGASDDASFSTYNIPIPEQNVDGALLLPSIQTLRVQE
jgi:hypothetical protein